MARNTAGYWLVFLGFTHLLCVVCDPFVSEWREMVEKGDSDGAAQSIAEFLANWDEKDLPATDPRIAQIPELIDLLASASFHPRNPQAIGGLIKQNFMLSNLVALSPLRTTDSILTSLTGYPHALTPLTPAIVLKVLVLTSARNNVTIPRLLLFQQAQEETAFWFSTYIRLHNLVLMEPIAYSNLVHFLQQTQHDRAYWNRLDELANSIYYGSTYISNQYDSLVKAHLNSALQGTFLGRYKLVTPPDRRLHGRRGVVVTRSWNRHHSVHRTVNLYIQALSKAGYELTLVSLTNPVAVTDGFVRVEHVDEEKLGMLEAADLVIKFCHKNKFYLAFFPEIGMSWLTLFLANMPLAPLQFTFTGHPVSSYGGLIDYFVSGDLVEPLRSTPFSTLYSERVLLMPGFGAVHNRRYLDYRNFTAHQLPLLASVIPSVIYIACPWEPQKINAPLLAVLAEMRDRVAQESGRHLVFRFYTTLVKSVEMALVRRSLQTSLGERHVQLFGKQEVQAYLQAVSSNHFVLEAHHFGGCNTVLDVLSVGLAVVTWQGHVWSNRIGSAMIRHIGLEQELVATNREEYLTKAVRLAVDDAFRVEVTRQVRAVDLEAMIYRFSETEAEAFPLAIAHVVENHHKLKGGTKKSPIVVRKLVQEEEKKRKKQKKAPVHEEL